MAARYWGEEVEEDAIYAVYLRKVRYHAPNVTGLTVIKTINQIIILKIFKFVYGLELKFQFNLINWIPGRLLPGS